MDNDGRVFSLCSVAWVASVLLLACGGQRESSARDAREFALARRPKQVDGASEPLVADLAVGVAHACVSVRDGVWCWGEQSRGASSGADRSHAVRIDGIPPDAVSVVAGTDHACVCTRGRTLYCWQAGRWASAQEIVGAHCSSASAGGGSVAALDDVGAVAEVVSIHETASSSRGVARGRRWSLVRGGGHSGRILSVGPVATCVVDDQGRFDCWGSGAMWTPAQLVLPGVEQLAVGPLDVCVATEAGVSCWGDTPLTEAELSAPAVVIGSGRLARRVRWHSPRAVPGIGHATGVGVGIGRGCALLDNHDLWCWGAGRMYSTHPPPPVVPPVVVSSAVEDFDLEGPSGCLLNLNREIWCWGRIGEFGGGDREIVSAPPGRRVWCLTPGGPMPCEQPGT